MGSIALWEHMTAFFFKGRETLWGHNMVFIFDEYERVKYIVVGFDPVCWRAHIEMFGVKLPQHAESEESSSQASNRIYVQIMSIRIYTLQILLLNFCISFWPTGVLRVYRKKVFVNTEEFCEYAERLTLQRIYSQRFRAVKVIRNEVMSVIYRCTGINNVEILHRAKREISGYPVPELLNF